MLGAAGAGGEAALLTKLNPLLVWLADPLRRCDAGLPPALPLVDSMLTQVLAAQVAAALADDLGPLFDAIVETIPPPKCDSLESDNLQCLVANIDFDDFKGKMGIGRITNGSIKSGQAVALQKPGEPKRTGRINKLFVFDNLGQREVEDAKAGEIIM